MFNTSLNNALTRANSDIISGYPMPSTKRDILTIGASGTSYIAPANGWFFAKGNWYGTGTGFYIALDNDGKYFGTMTLTGASGPSFGKVVCPAAKGDTIILNYSTVTMTDFVFVYAEGEK